MNSPRYSSRACDSCRRRKVKCNSTNPCANCRTSQLSCTYIHQARRRGPRVSKRAPNSETQQLQQYSPVSVTRNASIVTESNTISPTRREGRRESFPETIDARATAILPFPTLHRHASSSGRSSSIGSPTVSVVTELSLGYDFGTIHTRLVATVEAALAFKSSTITTTTIVDLVHNCIDLFLQYMFPNTPIAHEGTLRAAASLFLSENHPDVLGTALRPYNQAFISYAKAFTLITALCAFVTSVMPESLLPKRDLLTGPFLQSSRAMLRLYENYDLEQPDSTSLTIRIWQSGALQNSTGRAGGAWHCHSEASLLALQLRLYDENAVTCDSAVESRLLRANFWLLYSADKAAAALGSRTSVLSEPLFDDDLTLLENGENEESLLDEKRDIAEGSLEQRICVGFHLKTQIWAAAATVISKIKAYIRRQKRLGEVVADKDAEMVLISQANIHFSTVIYRLPPWLKHPGNVDGSDSEVATYQRTCFWVQRSNIMTTYHCLKLVILQKCIENNILEVLGLTGQAFSSSMRKVEIVQDFIDELQVVPFLCYKVQGEAGVERIRHVGSILLELAQTVENCALKDRAKSQFAQLLDFLARLDSKASDALSKSQH